MKALWLLEATTNWDNWDNSQTGGAAPLHLVVLTDLQGPRTLSLVPFTMSLPARATPKLPPRFVSLVGMSLSGGGQEL